MLYAAAPLQAPAATPPAGAPGRVALLDGKGQQLWGRGVPVSGHTGGQIRTIGRVAGGWLGGGSVFAGAAGKGLVFEIDDAGELRWTRLFDPSVGNDIVRAAIPAGDGLLVAVDSDINSKNPRRPLVARLAADGALLAQRTFGAAAGSSFDVEALAALPTVDGLAMVGRSLKTGSERAWLARIDRWGNRTCEKGDCLGKGSGGCGDKKACTADACVAGKGCVHTPLTGAACDDGQPCTLPSTCAKGTCTKGAPRLRAAVATYAGAAATVHVHALTAGGFAAVGTLKTGGTHRVAMWRRGDDLKPAASKAETLLAGSAEHAVVGLSLPGDDLVVASVSGAADASGSDGKLRVRRIDGATAAVRWTLDKAHLKGNLARGAATMAGGDVVIVGDAKDSSGE